MDVVSTNIAQTHSYNFTENDPPSHASGTPFFNREICSCSWDTAVACSAVLKLDERDQFDKT